MKDKTSKSNGSDKKREIVFQPTITLPAISTAKPAQDYSFGSFLHEWVLQAPGLRSSENLANCAHPPIFEWEEAIEALYERTKAALAADPDAPKEPPVPEQPKFSDAQTPEAKAANLELAGAFLTEIEAYQEARKPYDKALDAIRVGEILYVSEAAFQAAKKAAEDAINEKITPVGQTPAVLDPAWGRRVLKHYWHFAQSRAVALTDIPVEVAREPEAAAQVANN